MKPDIELRQIRYFVVVAEELNFTRAAERLKMAQPPLSRQIQSLEQAVGFTLFERTNRRVELTEAGLVFLEDCRQILDSIERSVQVAQRIATGKTGRIIVGFEGSAHHQLILKFIYDFRIQYPDVDLIMQEMSSSKQVEALQKGNMDIGLIEPIVAQDDLEVMTLCSEPLVLAMNQSHPLRDQQLIRLEQLATEEWITGRRDAGCGLLLRILEACTHAGFTPNIQQETNDLQMTLGLVASGFGITLLPESSAVSQDSIIYRSLEAPAQTTQLAIAYLCNRRSPITALFVQMIESHFS